MDKNPEHAAAEAAASARDLMGVLSLPALWTGRDARTVMEIAASAVAALVPVRVMFCKVRFPGDAAPVLRVRIGDEPWSDRVPADWESVADHCEHVAMPSGSCVALDSPHGALRATRLYMAAGTAPQWMWFASRDTAFPLRSHLALMRAITTLAAAAIRTAHIDHERRQAERAKDEFLAMLGHELRNPLAPIVTAMELIRLRSGKLDREHEMIARQVQHLRRLVDDLLDVTRITQERFSLRQDEVALRETVLDALDRAIPLIEEKGHAVDVDLDDVPHMIRGDAHRLSQVFANVLINAAKYTPPHGRISIRGRVSSGWATVEVSDSGSGMDAGLRARVFDLFHQGRTTLDRSLGGLGIGLAIARSIVTLHGGTIEALSDGPGKGSTFAIRLPTCPASRPRAPAAQPTPVVEQRGTVLLVDDNADALDSLHMLLEMHGFEVHSAAAPEQAVPLARRVRPGACVLDIGLPGMSGYQLVAALRDALGPGAGTRYIALTGYGQSADRQAAIKAGFDAHLVKPVDIARMVETLRDELRRG